MEKLRRFVDSATGINPFSNCKISRNVLSTLLSPLRLIFILLVTAVYMIFYPLHVIPHLGNSIDCFYCYSIVVFGLGFSLNYSGNPSINGPTIIYANHSSAIDLFIIRTLYSPKLLHLDSQGLVDKVSKALSHLILLFYIKSL